MELQRQEKSSFFEENFKGVTDFVAISCQSEGKNASQTQSNSAADRKIEETSDSFSVSGGEVRETTVLTQSSGKSYMCFPSATIVLTFTIFFK